MSNGHSILTGPRPEVQGFLDHWESYDFTLTKLHLDVPHRCMTLFEARTEQIILDFLGNHEFLRAGNYDNLRNTGNVRV